MFILTEKLQKLESKSLWYYLHDLYRKIKDRRKKWENVFCISDIIFFFQRNANLGNSFLIILCMLTYKFSFTILDKIAKLKFIKTGFSFVVFRIEYISNGLNVFKPKFLERWVKTLTRNPNSIPSARVLVKKETGSISFAERT